MNILIFLHVKLVCSYTFNMLIIIDDKYLHCKKCWVVLNLSSLSQFQ